MSAVEVTDPATGRAARDAVLEVCARHADALAEQVEAAGRAVSAQRALLEPGRVAELGESVVWVAATLRVVADSLGELHTVLDEASAVPAGAEPVAVVLTPIADAVAVGRRPEVAAVNLLFARRHRLAPDVLRSLADIWVCASAARYGAPAEEFWSDPELFTGHDLAECAAENHTGDHGDERGDEAGGRS